MLLRKSIRWLGLRVNIRITKWQEFISKLTHETSSKYIWNVIAKFNGKPFKPVEVLRQPNSRCHDNKDKANALVDHYQKISSNDQSDQKFWKTKTEPEIIICVRENIYATNNEPYNELFSIKELQSALNKKKSTSPGADTIHYDMLKICLKKENGNC